MDRLSGLDASFLYLETPEQLMHVCGLIVLDPSTIPGGYAFPAVRAEIDRRVRDVPAFTRKLRKVPLRLDHPIWVQDTHFDIDRHVHRLALPAPGGYDELVELASHLAGIPLDRSRPLWQMWVIEGLRRRPGRGLPQDAPRHRRRRLRREPDLPPVHPRARRPAAERRRAARRADRDPRELELVGRAVVRNLSLPVAAVKLLTPSVTLVTGTVDRARRGIAMAAPFSAPAHVVQRHHHRPPRDRLRRPRPRHDQAGQERHRHHRQRRRAHGRRAARCAATSSSRGELPDTSLLATVPVSVRGCVAARGRGQQGLGALHQARHRRRGPARAAARRWPSTAGTPRTTTTRSAPTPCRTGPSSPRRAPSASPCAPTPGCAWPSGTRWCTTW